MSDCRRQDCGVCQRHYSHMHCGDTATRHGQHVWNSDVVLYGPYLCHDQTERVAPPPRPTSVPPLPPTSAGKATEGWWVISESVLAAGLRRCAEGDDPGVVAAEMYANSDIERPS